MSSAVLKRLRTSLLALDRATGRRLRASVPVPMRRFLRQFLKLPVRLDDYFSASPEIKQYVPPFGLLPWFNPLEIKVVPSLEGEPYLNILIPAAAMTSMSGGPSTAINIGARLALRGVRVRFVSTDVAPDKTLREFLTHLQKVAETDRDIENIEVVDGSDRVNGFAIGKNDIFLATAWWTAQMAKYVVRHTNHHRFIYLIQDYEPLLHPASSMQALAEETYSLEHLPIINTRFLYEFLRERKIGQYCDDAFADHALIFEPAVNRRLFFPEKRRPGSKQKRRLLFYARPKTAPRNLFELGVAAMQKLIMERLIDPEAWDFLAMGESFDPVDLGGGARLVPLPWLDLEGYARQMRGADVLLSLMLSPHPSYPPLEMAVCDGMVVTTVFATKTAERLAQISPNIIGVRATIEEVAAGLLRAIRAVSVRRNTEPEPVQLPETWSASFEHLLPRLHDELLGFFRTPPLHHGATGQESSCSRPFPGYRDWPKDRYEVMRFATLSERSASYPKIESGLFSFITTIWNTDPQFLAALAESVFGQDCGADCFEWVILDNGTDREDTRTIIDQIAKQPNVVLLRVDKNAGIVGGLRLCLERARNRYVMPLDSDDLLTPDCVRVMGSALAAAGYPACAYTDEDKVSGTHFQDPYCKPGWDPVLFTHSCYIAHLCALDRKHAIELGAYTDREAEGSHDWDSFLRFWKAGHVPLHVPEVVYSWRMHPQSTSGNINSKNYIYSSQLNVLNKFISLSRTPEAYRVELSPLFGGAPDWRFVRIGGDPISINTAIHGGKADTLAPSGGPGIDHCIERTAESLSALLTAAKTCAAEGSLLHILSPNVMIDQPNWAAEAITLMELFPDTVIVGGRIHDGRVITAGDCYFGFGTGCDSPNVGRLLSDPGYFAQMWKPHSADAVPIEHSVARPDFLVDALTPLVDLDLSFPSLGIWLGAAARERRRRVIYSPFFSAATSGKMREASATERAAFRITYAHLIPNTKLLSPRLGLTTETAYTAISRAERAKQEESARLLQYDDEGPALSIADRLIARTRRYQSGRSPKSAAHQHTDQPSFSLMTAVWDTSPAFLAELADSIFAQDCDAEFEWIILDNGSMRSDTRAMLSRLAENSSVRLLRVEKNVGIVRGMRLCLEAATKDYVMPVDSDDVVTNDAFARIVAAVNDGAAPSFVFSDEDILDRGRLTSPFRRGGFDPILNSSDSYIWHLCCFRRDKAIELGVYSEADAEYCHDWDTVSRFWRAGESIRHIPHVLYHWRSHTKSSSNSGSMNRGSLASVQRLMERTILQQKKPANYEVRPFPISRGVEQCTIVRKRAEPLSMCLLFLHSRDNKAAVSLSPVPSGLGAAIAETRDALVDCGSSADFAAAAKSIAEIKSAVVLVLAEGLQLRDAAGVWDAMLLFEMHTDLAAAAGRIVDANDTIVSCCAPRACAGQPWIGKSRTDPGDYALALKQQTVDAITDGYFFCRTDILREACEVNTSMRLAERIASIARSRGMRLGYSPLIEAVQATG